MAKDSSASSVPTASLDFVRSYSFRECLRIRNGQRIDSIKIPNNIQLVVVVIGTYHCFLLFPILKVESFIIFLLEKILLGLEVKHNKRKLDTLSK
jgi:hypothetical protein